MAILILVPTVRNFLQDLQPPKTLTSIERFRNISNNCIFNSNRCWSLAEPWAWPCEGQRWIHDAEVDTPSGPLPVDNSPAAGSTVKVVQPRHRHFIHLGTLGTDQGRERWSSASSLASLSAWWSGAASSTALGFMWPGSTRTAWPIEPDFW